MIRSEELESAWPKLIEAWMGSGSVTATRVASAENSGPGSLVFAGKPEQLASAVASGAELIIAAANLTPPVELPSKVRLFRTSNVGLAMAAILPRFDEKKQRFGVEGKVHPQACVDPTAKIGRNVTIGPFAVIGAEAMIGDNAMIGAHTVVETRAKIGARTVLHPHVHFGAACEVGTDGEIHPHTTIGSDGFGFSRDKEGHLQKLPQLGIVVLGDRVEIGSNCAIDRAAFDVTRIRSGTKLDNLCHIAHNCDIGEDSAIAAGFMIAGSSKIGKRFMTGGNSVVTDHVMLADDVILAGRSTVTNSIEKGGAYGGYPLQPIREHLKTLASAAHVPALRKHVSRIMKQLGLQEDKE